jgi:hypothetical protein
MECRQSTVDKLHAEGGRAAAGKVVWR